MIKTIFALFFILASPVVLATDLQFKVCSGGATTAPLVTYGVEIQNPHVRITQDGSLIVDQDYVDLHQASGTELSNIQQGFQVYFSTQVTAAFTAQKTTSGKNLDFLVGVESDGEKTLVYNDGAIEAASKLCHH